MSDVVNLSVVEPDFPPPEHALNADIKGAKEGKTHYAPTHGVQELRHVLIKKAFNDY